LRYEPCDFDILVDTHFDLNDFGFNAYILHTTGHSGNSISLVIDNEIAIVGDTMFGVFKWSIMPPFGLDVKQLIKSCGKLLDTNCTTFIPGHGFAINRLLVQKVYNKRKNNYGVQHAV
jgi:glyoxylase-like metal-dependent hydrolase (beta-lactamase superfamily II)